MASFEGKKLIPSEINGGQQFKQGDGIPANALNDPIQAIIKLQEEQSSIEIDDALSTESTNAVQNKVVTKALDGKMGKKQSEYFGYSGTDIVQVPGFINNVATAIVGAESSAKRQTWQQRIVMTVKGTGQIKQGYAPVAPSDLSNKEYVDTKTLYLHEYTLVGTIAGVSNSSMYVKVLTKQDTAFTSAGDVFGLPPYANVIDVRFSVNNTIVVFERILLGELEIRYINQNGLFYSGIDIYNELSISGTPTITQLN